jgi:hypothetical protein
MLHTGYHYPGHPPIYALGGVAPINVGGLIRVNFHITDDAMSNPVVKIFVVIDGDVFEIAVVAENLSSESVTSFGRLSSHSFFVGRHVLSFYVVNETGFVSARAHLHRQPE